MRICCLVPGKRHVAVVRGTRETSTSTPPYSCFEQQHTTQFPPTFLSRAPASHSGLTPTSCFAHISRTRRRDGQREYNIIYPANLMSWTRLQPKKCTETSFRVFEVLLGLAYYTMPNHFTVFNSRFLVWPNNVNEVDLDCVIVNYS